MFHLCLTWPYHLICSLLAEEGVTDFLFMSLLCWIILFLESNYAKIPVSTCILRVSEGNTGEGRQEKEMRNKQATVEKPSQGHGGSSISVNLFIEVGCFLKELVMFKQELIQDTPVTCFARGQAIPPWWSWLIIFKSIKITGLIQSCPLILFILWACLYCLHSYPEITTERQAVYTHSRTHWNNIVWLIVGHAQGRSQDLSLRYTTKRRPEHAWHCSNGNHKIIFQHVDQEGSFLSSDFGVATETVEVTLNSRFDTSFILLISTYTLQEATVMKNKHASLCSVCHVTAHNLQKLLTVLQDVFHNLTVPSFGSMVKQGTVVRSLD